MICRNQTQNRTYVSKQATQMTATAKSPFTSNLMLELRPNPNPIMLGLGATATMGEAEIPTEQILQLR